MDNQRTTDENGMNLNDAFAKQSMAKERRRIADGMAKILNELRLLHEKVDALSAAQETEPKKAPRAKPAAVKGS